MKTEEYLQQLDLVTDYIYNHLDDELCLDILADVAGFSPYHWHRIYRAVRGESATQTIQRLRLERAADLLSNTQLPLKRIAFRSGFSNMATFSRAFSRLYGMSPSKYRGGERLAVFSLITPDHNADKHVVKVRESGPLLLAVARHQGSYMNIGRAFTRVTDRLNIESKRFAVYDDDPDITPTASLRASAGIEISDDVQVPAGLEKLIIPEGKHAVLPYIGPYSEIHTAYQWLYGTWLPVSGYIPADHPVFEEYVTDPAVTDPMKNVTRIVLPLR